MPAVIKTTATGKSGFFGFDTKQVIGLVIIIIGASMLTSYIQRKIAESKQAKEVATE